MVRPRRYDPAASYVAARSMLYNGVQYNAGDPFPTADFKEHRMRTLYDSRAIRLSDQQGEADPVTMESLPGGYYEVNAPWLDEPEKIRGKAGAEKRAAQLREEGEPAYHHGVEVGGDGEGGWYEVKADWMDEPVKVQGKDEANAEAARLRDEGPPPEHYALVTVTPTDDEQPEGKQIVDAPWLDNAETLDTLDAANERAQYIREVGPPEGGYDAEAIQRARAERAEDEAKVSAELQAEEAEKARVAAFRDSFKTSSATVDDVTTYTITGPGIEGDGEVFEGETAEDDAKARLVELQTTEPPEDWQPPAADADNE